MMRASRAAAAAALLAFASAGGAQGKTPGPFDGSWRMAAADDRADHGLMAITLQVARRASRGSGDYVMHQPMCSFLDGGPIRGDGACELTPGQFTDIRREGRRLVLTLIPTADGTPHRLTLSRRGANLVGTYRAGELARAVVLEPAP